MQSKGGTLGVTLAVAALVAAACSSQSSILESGEGDTTVPPSTAPGVDEGAIRDAVETQVSEAQVAIDRLFQEPELVEEEDDPLVEGLASYHTAGSARVDEVLEELEGLAALGLHYELHRDTNLTRSHVLIYNMELLDDETVEFMYCVATDFQVVDEDDQVTDEVSGVVIGDGEAHLVEDEWLIDSWEQTDSVDLNPGSVLVRECSIYEFGEDAESNEADEDADAEN